MKMRENLMAVLRHERPHFVPITIDTGILPRGYTERQLRDMGLCLLELGVSVFGIKNSNTTMDTSENIASFSADDRYTTISKQKHIVNRTYRTPIGQVSEKCNWGYATFEWPTECVIKDLKDYEIVEYVVNDTEYLQNYEDFLKTVNNVGDDGIVGTLTPKSPLQAMLLDLMGYTRFALDYHDCRHEFEELYDILKKKQLQMYKVVADSPAEIVLMDENVNGIVTSPKLFERYCIPFYDEVAQILHAKDKILMAHMDGKLKCLRDLMAKTKIDVIQGFTPPPIGDISITEAMTAWKGKVIWATFPATVALEGELDRVEKETINMFESAAPGDDFALGITDDIGDIRSTRYYEVLKTITRAVVERGSYPITKRTP